LALEGYGEKSGAFIRTPYFYALTEGKPTYSVGFEGEKIYENLC
jgi:hypothetical protein